MFKKIIVPLDLTQKHGPALEKAADLAMQGCGEITLLHVIEVIPGLPQGEEQNFYDRLEQVAVDHMTKIGTVLSQRNIPWRSEIRIGNRAPEITLFAAREAADLIVLTSPPFDPKNPAAGWGSLSWKVGILAQCPVLLVK